MDKLTKLEKIALISLGAGSAFNILLFAMGMTLDDATDGPWYVIRAVFAVIQFVAFDLTTIATVQAMRDGRRSGWAGSTVAFSALAAALIGLDVSIFRLPFLHAANAIVLPLFMLHLAAPRTGPAAVDSTDAASTQHITQAVQINVAAPQQLPDTVAAYIAARAADLPQHSPAALAAELGTSADTVRRAIAKVELLEEMRSV